MRGASVTVDEEKYVLVTEEDILRITRSLLRKHSDIIINRWRDLIRSQQNEVKPTQRTKKTTMQPRPAYADSLVPKLWTWPSQQGVSLIVGPEARSAPHAHLAEYGTKERTRQPYQRGPKGGGHGIRGKYEFVNFRGSKKHGRPPFKAGDAILTTGQAVARNWKTQAAQQTEEEFATAMAEGLAKELILLITRKG
jgi:hypothetical protein